VNNQQAINKQPKQYKKRKHHNSTPNRPATAIVLYFDKLQILVLILHRKYYSPLNYIGTCHIHKLHFRCIFRSGLVHNTLVYYRSNH